MTFQQSDLSPGSLLRYVARHDLVKQNHFLRVLPFPFSAGQVESNFYMRFVKQKHPEKVIPVALVASAKACAFFYADMILYFIRYIVKSNRRG